MHFLISISHFHITTLPVFINIKTIFFSPKKHRRHLCFCVCSFYCFSQNAFLKTTTFFKTTNHLPYHQWNVWYDWNVMTSEKNDVMTFQTYCTYRPHPILTLPRKSNEPHPRNDHLWSSKFKWTNQSTEKGVIPRVWKKSIYIGPLLTSRHVYANFPPNLTLFIRAFCV